MSFAVPLSWFWCVKFLEGDGFKLKILGIHDFGFWSKLNGVKSNRYEPRKLICILQASREGKTSEASRCLRLLRQPFKCACLVGSLFRVLRIASCKGISVVCICPKVSHQRRCKLSHSFCDVSM